MNKMTKEDETDLEEQMENLVVWLAKYWREFLLAAFLITILFSVTETYDQMGKYNDLAEHYNYLKNKTKEQCPYVFYNIYGNATKDAIITGFNDTLPPSFPMELS